MVRRSHTSARRCGGLQVLKPVVRQLELRVHKGVLAIRTPLNLAADVGLREHRAAAAGGDPVDDALAALRVRVRDDHGHAVAKAG